MLPYTLLIEIIFRPMHLQVKNYESNATANKPKKTKLFFRIVVKATEKNRNACWAMPDTRYT